MASFELLIAASAAKELEAIGTRRDRQRLVTRIRALATEPRPAGAQKLSGSDKLRVRQGRYRIVYRVDDANRTVTIVKIGDRKDVYR